MKKWLVAILTMALVFSLFACNKADSSDANTGSNENVEDNGEEEIEVNSVGTAYQSVFAASDKATAAEAVEELLTVTAANTELVSMEVQEGYLNGFTGEVTGFSSGVMFSPMIGSIPFVGYVFESDDPDALLDTLTDLADPAWNVCTQADETVSYIRDNLVFFLMCTNDDVQ